MHSILSTQLKRFFGGTDTVPDDLREFIDAVDRAYSALEYARAPGAPAVDASAQDYHALIQHSSDIVTVMGVDGLIQFNSPSVRTVLGYDPDEMVGKPGTEFLHPEDLEPTLVIFTRAFANPGTVEVARYRAKAADGTWIMVETAGHLGEWQGKPAFILNSRDITDRERAEDSSRQSAELFAKAFSASPAAMTVADRESGEYLDANEAFLRLTGFSREEVIGSKPSTLGIWSIPEDKKRFAELLDEQGFVRDLETEFRVKAGEIRHVSISAEFIEFSGRTCTLAISHDMTIRKEAERTIQYLAYHDALTGLPNRAFFKDRLQAAIDDAARSGQQVAVMFLDVDRFKLINDTLGHAAGDALLQTIGDDISSIIGSGEVVARIGGDEFTILLGHVDSVASVVEVADSVLRTVRASREILGSEIRPSVSIGVSLYPSHGSDPEVLMANADIAMYKAKDSGRDCFELFSASLTADTRERLAVESELRRAIDNDEFVLYYQPIVSVETGELRSLEALIRWNHPQRGLVPPDSFIQVAEETGAILRIGSWVIHTACTQAEKWRQEGMISVPIAVNVSGYQLQHSNLVRIVESCLKQTQLPASLLHLEITEGVALQDVERTVSVLRALRQLGVEISIDDFGTGYSSLTYLKRLPVDSVKIDRSFIADLATDPNDAAIASAIIAMAHSIGLRVIAEGIETETQLDFLRAHGCDEMQGFLKGRPMPAEKLEPRLTLGAPPQQQHAPRTAKIAAR